MKIAHILLRRWLPPEAIRLINHWSGRSSKLTGSYPSWQAASDAAEGYDAGQILERAERAMQAVRSGEAAFERDGFQFAEPAPPVHLIAGLLRAAALNDGRLNVLDFGGALGSTYHQCSPLLEDLASVTWHVVEQPHYAVRGQELFGDGVLSFSADVSTAIKDRPHPNAVVLSGVLQYLPDPWSVLREVADLGASTIVIDRTPIIKGIADAIALQTIPKKIVKSSYPARLFARSSLLAPLAGRYSVKAEWDAVDGISGGLSRRVEFKGFLLAKNRGQQEKIATAPRSLHETRRRSYA